jgi:RNA polymerase sigma-70 factor (family 1)
MTQGISETEFIGLFKEHHRSVKNYVYYKTGDMDLAEDIVQDTFLKFWEKKTEIKMATAKSLLFTIAGNLSRNKLDHRRVVMQFSNSFVQNPHTHSPEFEMELKEFDTRLQQAISGLNEINRVVFLMNRIDGMTYREIAGNIGITVKAVEKRMKKALDLLTEKMNHKL